MPSRRRLVRCCGILLAVYLGGCVGTSGDSIDEPTATPTQEEPTPTPEPIEYPTPTDCPDSPRMPEPEPHPDGGELPPIPDPPASLKMDTVKQYIEEFEDAFKSREVTTWYDAPVLFTRVNGSHDVRVITAGALIIDYGVFVSGRTGGDDNPAIFDGRYVASYLVTEEGVWRAERRYYEDEVDPHDDGELLQCFE